jgi:hypothetical protein
MPPSPSRVAVVIATRNRGPELLGTLTRLLALSERPRIVVVDNGSTDGTAELVRARHPDVQVVCQEMADRPPAARRRPARPAAARVHRLRSGRPPGRVPGGRRVRRPARGRRRGGAARPRPGRPRLGPGLCRRGGRPPPSLPEPRPLGPPPCPGAQRLVVGLAPPPAGWCGQTDRPPGRPRHPPTGNLIGPAPSHPRPALGPARAPPGLPRAGSRPAHPRRLNSLSKRTRSGDTPARPSSCGHIVGSGSTPT